MRCAEVQLLLQDLLDGRLSRGHADQVRTHVASCPGCNRELGLYRQVLEALETEATPEVQLADAVMATIHVQRSAAGRWSVWVYAAACLLLAVGLCCARPSLLATVDLYRTMTLRAGDVTRGWGLATSAVWSDVAERVASVAAVATELARPDSLSSLSAYVPRLHIPVLLVIAACAAALAVDLYCLRSALPIAGARQVVL